ncbi:amino acid transporter [Aureobasidium pullulans]|uniref:Amino acid transporter n=1 Tax=Aureobasidium pullulans TaxID=5580 RepID=A0A4S8T2H6_AURPU|nr:amino acid transporter [Aureobasidium pullulans]
MDTKQPSEHKLTPYRSEQPEVEEGTITVNTSGHTQELERNFSIVSICAVGIVTGNTWCALGGSIVVALYNGGPTGVIFEFLAVSVFYWMIGACIAELASAIPSSSGVYHWAAATSAPRYSKFIGFLAGYWNFFAWVFGSASMSSILANEVLAMWGLFHPDYVAERWHVFICYIIISWSCCAVVLFANRALPMVNNIGLFLTLGGCFLTILVCAIMPTTTGAGHATTAAVWSSWSNDTGYKSNGLVFVTGMLNGAFSVGTPDCVSHLAEEIPRSRVNVPKAIAAQLGVGFVTGLFYLIAIFYSINDIGALMNNPYTNPLAELYRQATGSKAGSCGLLIVVFLPTVANCIGTYITCGRMLWTLSRDRATPFSSTLGVISPRWGNPFAATVACLIITTILGLIYIGSAVAFNAFVGSFIILSSASYLLAILPHLLSGRKNIEFGPFKLPDKLAAVIMPIACAYIVAFIVIFCFPYSMPVSAETMNYSSAITGGLTVIIALLYPWQCRNGFVSPVEVARSIAAADVVKDDHE